MKDDEEVTKITNIILENYLIIKNNYLECIKSSEKYPRIDFLTAMKTYSSRYNIRPTSTGGKELLVQSLKLAIQGT